MPHKIRVKTKEVNMRCGMRTFDREAGGQQLEQRGQADPRSATQRENGIGRSGRIAVNLHPRPERVTLRPDLVQIFGGT